MDETRPVPPETTALENKPTLFESASKVAFLMLTATACVAFLKGILEPKDFMLLATGASAFYFSNKGTGPDFLGK